MLDWRIDNLLLLFSIDTVCAPLAFPTDCVSLLFHNFVD